MATNNGTILNPNVYKSFIPDQYKQGFQKTQPDTDTVGNFFTDSKISFADANPLSQPIRTLEFVRERILNSLNT